MFKIISFAKKQWYIMILIIALLFVQANCELALPEYTSNIVDVGIQYGGIDRPIPEVIRESSMKELLLFADEEEAEQIQNTYVVTKDSLYSLDEERLGDSKKEIEEEMDDLSCTMSGIESELYLLDQMSDGGFGRNSKETQPASGTDEKSGMVLSEESKKTLEKDMGILYQNAMMSGMKEEELKQAGLVDLILLLPDEQKEAVVSDIKNIMDDFMSEYKDIAGDALAIQYVQKEYEAIGVDTNAIQMDYLKEMAVRMGLLCLISMTAAILVGFFSSRLAAKSSRDLRNQIFQKVVSFSNAEMNDFSTASLITRSTNDIQQVQMTQVMLFRMVAYAPIMGIGGLVKVLHTNMYLSWIIAVAVAAVLLLVLVLMLVAMPKFKKMQELVDRLNLVSREILTGIPVIRAFSREKHEEKRFDRASRELMKTQLFTNRAMAVMMPTMMFIMNGVTVLIIWFGANGIDTGKLQVGDMMAFITYTMQIVMSFLMIAMVSVMLPRAGVAADRIDQVLKSETLILDGGKQVADKEKKGKIAFHEVSFQYSGADDNAIENISFTANPGETTAIIGSTGCGKTTLVSLIPRLFDVTGGSITIDGLDIREWKLHDLRDMIGFVPQKGILFSGDIESNLRFGAGGSSMEELRKASEIAQAAEFIDSKPDGYQTPIAQGGSNVSGGQKQRLAIARAIAKKPKIYIFDDSFSALDYKTDAALRKALQKNVADATVLIVAQRISTIMHADKILVLDDGKLVGMGTHDELLANNEVYQQIAASQLKKEEMNENGKNAGKEER